jgi:signal transduction histidine kinase
MPYLVSLVIFTFSALSFSILTVSYWTQRRRPGTVFPVFTLVCAAAFLLNLAFQAGAPMTLGPMLVRDLAVSLLAPLMLHIVYEPEARHLPAELAWRIALISLYILAVASALLLAFGQAGMERAPAAILLATAVIGLAVLACSRRPLPTAGRAHARWIAGLFTVLSICAAFNLARPGGPSAELPDYLLLAFFCVTLYYRERLVFFDLLVKRGAFFLLGLVVLALVLYRLPADSSPWICALALLPLWLLAPWIYSRLDRAIDRVWLRRPYSAVDAEREFIRAIQGASSIEDLRARAVASLSRIFQAPADVRFDAPFPPGLDSQQLAEPLEPRGYVLLSARSNSIPFLSDDRRLLQSLTRTLSVVLENVRFRIGEEELRWLASRAELKALRAQINPHFLFNALNAIAGLIQDQPQLADETIEQLAQVFRYTLRKSDSEWVPLGEEVEFVAAYLRVEQARFGDRLQVSFDLDPAAAAVPVPAMYIQPLVENAIRHGAAALEGRGAVALRTALEDGSVRVEVCDNGPGFPPEFSLDSAAETHGLCNVAKRLRGYYGPSARLCWECGSLGTRVWFTVLARGADACAHSG